MPRSERSYIRNRQEPPERFDRKTFKTVDLSHTSYRGEKFDVPGARAIVGKEKKTGEWKIQSILIPKDPKDPKEKRGFKERFKGLIKDEKKAQQKYAKAARDFPEHEHQLKEIRKDEHEHQQKLEKITHHERREHEKGDVF